MAVEYKPQFPLSQDIVGSSEEWPSDTMMQTSPIRILVMAQAIDLWTLEMNAMVKYLGHVTMDFYALTMYEVHAI